MKSALKAFWPKITVMTLLAYKNLRIFNIYLLCIKQSLIKELRFSQEHPKSILLIYNELTFFFRKYLKIMFFTQT